MTTPATGPVPGPFAREHHVPEALFGVLAALALLGANAAAMTLWWWVDQGTATSTRTWLVGVLVALLLASVLLLMLRHPIARRAAVGALAVAVVIDAVVIGYELSGAALFAL